MTLISVYPAEVFKSSCNDLQSVHKPPSTQSILSVHEPCSPVIAAHAVDAYNAICPALCWLHTLLLPRCMLADCSTKYAGSAVRIDGHA
eukprot:2224788-Amphidinium_carterae.1